MKSILIVAPHADDEVLGCGGIISFYKKKKFNVYVLIVSNASKSNNSNFTPEYLEKIRNECKKANKFLKVNDLFFLEHPATNLSGSNIAIISEDINKFYLKIKPLYVFIPHYSDIHEDHKVISKASLVALRPNLKSNLKSIFMYETLSETEWGEDVKNSFNPNFYFSLSRDDIQNKINAFKFYKTQIKKYPHPRSKEGIINLAKFRGQSICQNYAESFELVRSINK